MTTTTTATSTTATATAARAPRRICYRGYYLAPASTPADDGRYRARVVVMSLDGDRTRSQRFVDMGLFDTLDEAEIAAIENGKAWVDVQLREEALLRGLIAGGMNVR